MTAVVPPAPMKRWRIWLVLGVIVALLAGHLYDIITQTEQWPFSFYPMYARIEKRRVRVLSLFATIKRDGKRHVLRITDAPEIPQIPALSEGRLRVILLSAWNGGGGNNVAAANTVLADYLRLYESRRIAGEIEGPQLLDVRLYRLTWRLRSNGRRVARPDQTELLTTVGYHDAIQ